MVGRTTTIATTSQASLPMPRLPRSAPRDRSSGPSRRRRCPALLPIRALDQAPAIEEVDLGGDLGLETDPGQERFQEEIGLPAQPCADGCHQVLEAAHHPPVAA